jgi:hypothetical protein
MELVKGPHSYEKVGCKLEAARIVFVCVLVHCKNVSLYIYHPSLIIENRDFGPLNPKPYKESLLELLLATDM